MCEGSEGGGWGGIANSHSHHSLSSRRSQTLPGSVLRMSNFLVVLSRDEVRHLIKQLAPDMNEHFDSWFDSIDLNKDGELDHAELKKYMGSTEFENSALMKLVLLRVRSR